MANWLLRWNTKLNLPLRIVSWAVCLLLAVGGLYLGKMIGMLASIDLDTLLSGKTKGGAVGAIIGCVIGLVIGLLEVGWTMVILDSHQAVAESDGIPRRIGDTRPNAASPAPRPMTAALTEAHARGILANPAASGADLAAIASGFPALRSDVARHPAAYPELLRWLSSLGDPAISWALAQRQGR